MAYCKMHPNITDCKPKELTIQMFFYTEEYPVGSISKAVFCFINQGTQLISILATKAFAFLDFG